VSLGVTDDFDESYLSGQGFMRSPVDIPLVIDVDGTLVKSDLLIETAFEFFARDPHLAPKIVVWLRDGKAVLKRNIAAISQLNVAYLPYNEAVLSCAHAARQAGRKVYLASAADSRLVEAIADHLGCFDGWFASDGVVNLSGPLKAERLAQAFGHQGFDYIGNDADDLPVWRLARTAIVINASPRVMKAIDVDSPRAKVLPASQSGLKAYISALRPSQWIKNTLIFVPLLTAHVLTERAWLNALAAFVIFCVAASATYIFNDIVDIQADRQHPRKKYRPFASGDISIIQGIVWSVSMIGISLCAAGLLNPELFLAVAGYIVVTLAYSMFLKRYLMIDAIVLAGLYTVRVAAGAVAVAVVLSEWLLAFSMFLFFCLALIKRYSELALRFDGQLPDPSNRDYKITDLTVISSLSAASGFSAVIVFSLYLSSDTVDRLYRHPELLWIVCPFLMYWISRLLVLSHRRVLHDDPVIFALRDRVSQFAVAAVLLLGFLAV
jgi:4-hydroxybenzoate polyprenyltransferase/phosphoserine phosphatase